MALTQEPPKARNDYSEKQALCAFTYPWLDSKYLAQELVLPESDTKGLEN